MSENMRRALPPRAHQLPDGMWLDGEPKFRGSVAARPDIAAAGDTWENDEGQWHVFTGEAWLPLKLSR